MLKQKGRLLNFRHSHGSDRADKVVCIIHSSSLSWGRNIWCLKGCQSCKCKFEISDWSDPRLPWGSYINCEDRAGRGNIIAAGSGLLSGLVSASIELLSPSPAPGTWRGLSNLILSFIKLNCKAATEVSSQKTKSNYFVCIDHHGAGNVACGRLTTLNTEYT